MIARPIIRRIDAHPGERITEKNPVTGPIMYRRSPFARKMLQRNTSDAYFLGPSTVSMACMTVTFEFIRQYALTLSAFALKACVSTVVVPCLPL
jgi:hypothetical protein